jgi:uncharacterized repeat protein (TIGR03803 family)
MRPFLPTVLAALAPILAHAAPTETILHAFSSLPRSGQAGVADASQPESGLVLSSSGTFAGTLFGTTFSGGSPCGSNGPGCGAVVSVTPPAAPETTYAVRPISRFADNLGGGYPIGPLITGPGGVLFGTSSGGGIGGSGAGHGTIFELTPPTDTVAHWTRIVLYRFGGGNDGADPQGRLLITLGGTLYGTTAGGGSGSDGTVFKLQPPAPGKTVWKKTILYNFTGTDGAKPLGGLVLIRGNLLAGVTSTGGASNFGVVFSLAPPTVPGAEWNETKLYDFPPYTNGVFPGAVELIADAQGALYGTTVQGGTAGDGTVFKLTPPGEGQTAWTQAVLYSFAGGSDGADPQSGLVADKTGALYGTTQQGGSASLGTVYKLTPPAPGSTTWTETVLHSFAGGRDGSVPYGPVVLDQSGAIFGMTNQGGGACPQWTASGCGTVFEITQ